MPMSESLRSIQVFVATYEERSFTAAAKREHATQSGVSQHVRKLEDRLGVKLFSRDRERAVGLFGDGLTGEIVVGLMPTMTRSALAPALSRFTDEQPNVAIRVVEAFSAVLTQQVRAGELDFAIVPAIPNTPGIRSRHFLRTIELLVSRPESRLRHLDPVRLKDLGSLRLVVPGPQNTRRRSIETYLAANGVRCDRT